MTLLKKTAPFINCFSFLSSGTIAAGLPTRLGQGGSRGVILGKKDPLVPISKDLPPPLDAEGNIIFGWYSPGRGMSAKSPAMPSQIIVRVTGLRSVRQLQGKAPVLVVAADGCEALNGETVSFGRQSPTVLLCLNWSRKTGREDAASTLDVPSVLIETRGGKPSVLGLTSCRQDIHGVPNLWRQPFDRYRRILAKAAEHLDHDLMYGQNG